MRFVGIIVLFACCLAFALSRSFKASAENHIPEFAKKVEGNNNHNSIDDNNDLFSILSKKERYYSSKKN